MELATVLVVPGFTGSGPEHWQSLWTASRPHFHCVQQRDWDHPDPQSWCLALDQAIEQARPPIFLVAHSLGCIAVAHRFSGGNAGGVAGAFLVAPADVEAPDTPDEIRCFAPIRQQPLPFPSRVVFSSNDPYLSQMRASQFAASWQSKLVPVGAAGHINTASGHGPWPEGFLLLQEFARECGAQIA